jgi:oxygen-independent coproporphyrinogen-3 oxidase
MMDPRFLGYAERQVPRYTSYPTAPHFTSAVNAATMQRWLSELAPDQALSLYVHVPYCREICWYCGCNTFAAQRDEPVAEYVEALLHEIDLVASLAAARRISALHWGGGTPNMLSPERFELILDHLSARFDFGALNEHAIEIDPRQLTPEQARTYARRGVARASLGVQDFNAHVQRSIGRVQPFDTVWVAVDRLRNAGIAEISMDLMYGLPNQSIADVCTSARLAASLAPQRIALFGYAHVPWFKARQRLIDTSALGDAEHRFNQAEAARDVLIDAGYVPVGLDHFARPDDALAKAAQGGTLSRNFQGYVADNDNKDTAIIGLGPSAISTLPQGYVQNISDVGAWRKAIGADRLACARGHTLSDDDRRRREIIEGIMCRFDVDLAPYGGWTAFARERERLNALAGDGLVTIHATKLTIPEGAWPFCRVVAQTFDGYAGARHSAAV